MTDFENMMLESKYLPKLIEMYKGGDTELLPETVEETFKDVTPSLAQQIAETYNSMIPELSEGVDSKKISDYLGQLVTKMVEFVKERAELLEGKGYQVDALDKEGIITNGWTRLTVTAVRKTLPDLTLLEAIKVTEDYNEMLEKMPKAEQAAKTFAERDGVTVEEVEATGMMVEIDKTAVSPEISDQEK